jgi:hypothetical protein
LNFTKAFWDYILRSPVQAPLWPINFFFRKDTFTFLHFYSQKTILCYSDAMNEKANYKFPKFIFSWWFWIFEKVTFAYYYIFLIIAHILNSKDHWLRGWILPNFHICQNILQFCVFSPWSYYPPYLNFVIGNKFLQYPEALVAQSEGRWTLQKLSETISWGPRFKPHSDNLHFFSEKTFLHFYSQKTILCYSNAYEWES